jgi:tetratricopeptide (TPR) repeat protein
MNTDEIPDWILLLFTFLSVVVIMTIVEQGQINDIFFDIVYPIYLQTPLSWFIPLNWLSVYIFGYILGVVLWYIIDWKISASQRALYFTIGFGLIGAGLWTGFYGSQSIEGYLTTLIFVIPWAYIFLSSKIEDSSERTSGKDSPASRESTTASSEPTLSLLSRSDTESSNSGLLEAVNETLERGDNLREEADSYRDADKYDRALDTYDNAQAIYESALETASESDLIDTDEIEQKLGTIEDERWETHRQQLQDEVESLRSDLDHAATLADEGTLEEAKDHLEEFVSNLSSARESATQHDFDDLHDEIATLEQRGKERLEEVSDRLKAHPIPDEIQRAPNTSVAYDALTDREPIGGGGNADVTKATLPAPDGDVTLAIKEPRLSGTLHTDQVERMLQEAETWDKLDDHDHIVGVVDYGSEPIPWIAMEYMDAGHLGQRSGEMDVPQALWTAIAVTKGVRHAHRRGVAHLDLKPQNILFRTVGDAWDVPKVADWGLSKQLLEQSKSVEGMSVEYAAPEQFDDDYGPADDITDIYQLGAVFYELFTGRPPFEGQPFKVIDMVKSDQPTPPSEIADVPEELDDILLTALAKEKDSRYDDIVLLRNDLQNIFEDY